MSEQTTTASMLADLRRWGKDIRAEHQAVYTDPLYAFADRVDAFVEANPGLVNELAHARPIDKVPFSVHNLPPNLFDSCGGRPFIPQSEQELEFFLDSFWTNHLILHASVPGFHAHATRPDFRTNLTNNLRMRREMGITIDPNDWARYQEVYREQLTRGFYTLGHNASIMTIPDLLQFADERGILAAIPGRQKEYLLTSLSSPHRIGMYMRVPIGAYGSSFASRLSRTATLLCDMIEQDRELAGDLWHTVDAHYNVVANHSTRGRANRAVTQGVNYGNQESAIVAAQEGIISMVAAINMLTAEQVPGFEREDGAERLLEQLAKDDMLNKLTLFIAQGVAGSVGVNGIYIPGMVQNEGGKLSFSEDALARLESLRNGVTAIMHARWTDYHARAAEKGVEAADAELPQVLLGLPCLAAGPYRRPDGSLTPGAITRLTSTFVKVFNSITPTYKQPRVVFPWLGPRVYQE